MSQLESQVSYRPSRSNGASGREAVHPGAAQQISIDAIAKRAHEMYRERGCAHGLDQQDWLAAELELKGART